MDNQEIEAKFQVRDLSKIALRLRELNAREIHARVLERNIRFDTPERTLRKSGRVLRLRQDDETRLTFKGPNRNTEGVLSRVEIEFEVGDFGKARAFLEALGYERLFYYEKYRTTYELGRTHIMLDELPYGTFVEIEGENADSIHALADQLKLRWDASIPVSYHVLYERIARGRGLESDELSFDLFRELRIGSEELGVRPAD
jgi:adenylate cyclase class 2